MVFKGFCLLMAVLFGWSITLQLNDVDPALWITLYAIGLLICALALFDLAWWWPYWVITLAFIAYALVLVPLKTSGNYFDNEEAREAGGLLIVALTITVVNLRMRKFKTRPPAD